MKHRIIQSALIAAALLLCAGLSPAADIKSGAAPESKPVSAPKATDKGTKAKTAKAAAKIKLVDINSASKAELKTLPGVGDADADKIIAGRPYLSKAQLTTRSVIPRGVYENLKTLVVARQKQNPKTKAGQK